MFGNLNLEPRGCDPTRFDLASWLLLQETLIDLLLLEAADEGVGFGR